MLKAVRKRHEFKHKGKLQNSIRAFISNLGSQENIIQALKESNFQPWLLNPGKLSFNIGGGIRTFKKKHTLRQFVFMHNNTNI